MGDLIAVLVQKDGELSRSLTAEDLSTLRLTEAEAWSLAITNLRTQIGALERTPNAQGAEVVTARSGLALSNLLLPETCRAGGANFDAFVVDRATYFYADQRVSIPMQAPVESLNAAVAAAVLLYEARRQRTVR